MFLQQARSEETAELLAEKARVAEEEASLLTQKAQEKEAEIQQIRLSVLKVKTYLILCSSIFTAQD